MLILSLNHKAVKETRRSFASFKSLISQKNFFFCQLISCLISFVTTGESRRANYHSPQDTLGLSLVMVVSCDTFMLNRLHIESAFKRRHLFFSGFYRFMNYHSLHLWCQLSNTLWQPSLDNSEDGNRNRVFVYFWCQNVQTKLLVKLVSKKSIS